MALNVNISSIHVEFNINCLGWNACKNLNAIILNRNDNIISNSNGVDSLVNCDGNYACNDAVFMFMGIKNAVMNCKGDLSDQSCKFAWITLWDTDQNDSELTVNCYDDSCEQMVINGLSTSKVNVTCKPDPYDQFGFNFGRSCSLIQVKY